MNDLSKIAQGRGGHELGTNPLQVNTQIGSPKKSLLHSPSFPHLVNELTKRHLKCRQNCFSILILLFFFAETFEKD